MSATSLAIVENDIVEMGKMQNMSYLKEEYIM